MAKCNTQANDMATKANNRKTPGASNPGGYSLSGVPDVFHVSQLKKCHAEMADIPLRDTVPLEAIKLDRDLTYEEKPIKILEVASRVTRNKVIKFCKVQWSHHTEDEATWEREEDLRKDHPHLFSSQPESRGRDSS